MEPKGFVAVFQQSLDRARIDECLASWLDRFEKLEQVVPRAESTVRLLAPEDVLWEANLQFRITHGDQFAWVYVSVDRLAMETTGFQDAEISFCLEVLLELPDLREIVDEKNQRRLDELERSGVI